MRAVLPSPLLGWDWAFLASAQGWQSHSLQLQEPRSKNSESYLTKRSQMCGSTWGMNNYFPDWSERGLLYFSIRKDILAFSPSTGRAILHEWHCVQTCISLGANSTPSAFWACPWSLQFSFNALHEHVMALCWWDRGRGEPLLSSQHCQSGWSRDSGLMCCKEGPVTPPPTFSAMALQFGPPCSAKQKTFPTHMGRPKERKWNSFFHYV